MAKKDKTEIQIKNTMSKFKNCQYLNWIEAAKKDTTGEVILQIKAGTENWRNIKIESLASGLFLWGIYY